MRKRKKIYKKEGVRRGEKGRDREMVANCKGDHRIRHTQKV
jgi:hypothetical protein